MTRYAGRSLGRIPVGSNFCVPFQTGSGGLPASCTMGTVFLPGGKKARKVPMKSAVLVEISLRFGRTYLFHVLSARVNAFVI